MWIKIAAILTKIWKLKPAKNISNVCKVNDSFTRFFCFYVLIFWFQTSIIFMFFGMFFQLRNKKFTYNVFIIRRKNVHLRRSFERMWAWNEKNLNQNIPQSEQKQFENLLCFQFNFIHCSPKLMLDLFLRGLDWGMGWEGKCWSPKSGKNLRKGQI